MPQGKIYTSSYKNWRTKISEITFPSFLELTLIFCMGRIYFCYVKINLKVGVPTVLYPTPAGGLYRH